MDQAQQDLYNNFFVILKSTCFREETTAFNFIGVLISNKKNKFVLETEKRPAQKLTLKLNHSDEKYFVVNLVRLFHFLSIVPCSFIYRF